MFARGRLAAGILIPEKPSVSSLSCDTSVVLDAWGETLSIGGGGALEFYWSDWTSIESKGGEGDGAVADCDPEPGADLGRLRQLNPGL